MSYLQVITSNFILAAVFLLHTVVPDNALVRRLPIHDSDPIDSLRKAAMIEQSRFKEKYDSKWEQKPTEFPHSEPAKVMVFNLNCEGECGSAVFRNRTSKGVEITTDDFNELVAILQNPKSFGNSTAACYYPKFGLVVYDSANVPTEYLGVCMSCNNYLSYPGRVKVKNSNEYRPGFTQKARNQLRELFFKWGIDYYGYSSSWDDKAEHDEYLKNKEQ